MFCRLNKDIILRFEFFGGLLYNFVTNEEYQLDFANAIFIYCIKNGYDVKKSYEMVNKILKDNTDFIFFEDFISEKILIKCKNRKQIKNDEDFINQILLSISEVKNIKHLSFPIQASLYLSSSCQLNCKFCFYDSKRKIYKNIRKCDDWIALIKKLKEYGIVYLSILGGEPTMYKDIDTILKFIDISKIKTTITTNGYYIKDSTFDIICNSKYITPTVSLQSLNNDTNKYLMGIDSINAVNTLKRFLREGKIPRINTVITNQSEKEICDIVDFCVNNGISDFYVDVYVENNTNAKLLKHTFREYRLLKEKVDNYIIKNGYTNKIFFQLQGCLLYSAYSDNIDSELETDYEKIKYGCEGGNTKIEIMPNGDVYPCVMFDAEQFKYDNVFDRDIKDIWYNSSYINFLRNYRCKNKTCMECKFYSFCNGGCPAIVLKNNGDITSDADFRCQIIKNMEMKNNE